MFLCSFSEPEYLLESGQSGSKWRIKNIVEGYCIDLILYSGNRTATYTKHGYSGTI